MRKQLTASMFSVMLVACGSESKVEDTVDPDALPSQTTGDPTTPTPDPDTATDPGGTTAVGDDDDDVTTTTLPTTVPTDITEDELCALAAALVVELDPYQTAEDGRVVYCHAGGGTNLHYIESDISSCLPHLNHPGDVFPTTGCDS